MELTIIVAIIAFLAVTLWWAVSSAKAKLTSSGEDDRHQRRQRRSSPPRAARRCFRRWPTTRCSCLRPAAAVVRAACKCQVLEGGGDIPLETDLRASWPRRPLASGLSGQGEGKPGIKVPEAVPASRRSGGVLVVSNRNISTFLKEVRRSVRRRSPSSSAAAVTFRSTSRSTTPSSSRTWMSMRSTAPTGQVQDVICYDQPEDTFAPTRWPPAEGQHHHAHHPYRHPPFDKTGGFMKSIRASARRMSSRKPGDKITISGLTASSSCRTTCPTRRS